MEHVVGGDQTRAKNESGYKTCIHLVPQTLQLRLKEYCDTNVLACQSASKENLNQGQLDVVVET